MVKIQKCLATTMTTTMEDMVSDTAISLCVDNVSCYSAGREASAVRPELQSHIEVRLA